MTLLQEREVQISPQSFFRFVDYSRVQYKDLFLEFVVWCATPRQERELKTQGDFARFYGLHIDTLTDWKKRPDFDTEVEYRRIQFFREYAPDVYYALVQKALTGNVAAVRLYAEIFEGFREKKMSKL